MEYRVWAARRHAEAEASIRLQRCGGAGFDGRIPPERMPSALMRDRIARSRLPPKVRRGRGGSPTDGCTPEYLFLREGLRCRAGSKGPGSSLGSLCQIVASRCSARRRPRRRRNRQSPSERQNLRHFDQKHTFRYARAVLLLVSAARTVETTLLLIERYAIEEQRNELVSDGLAIGEVHRKVQRRVELDDIDVS